MIAAAGVCALLTAVGAGHSAAPAAAPTVSSAPSASTRSTLVETTHTFSVHRHGTGFAVQPGDVKPLVGGQSVVLVGFSDGAAGDLIQLVADGIVIDARPLVDMGSGALGTAFTITHAKPGTVTYLLRHATSGASSSWTVRTSPQDRALATIYRPGAVERGHKAVVVGKVAGGKRKVALQVKASGRWSTIRSSRTQASGKFTFSLPTASVGVRQLRVVAPATRRKRAAVSKVKPFTVFAPWKLSAPTPEETTTTPVHADDFVLPTKPTRWNPCAPIGVRVNIANAPASADADVSEALNRLNQASGLQFAYRGTTDVVPGPGYLGYPLDTQVVIAWAAAGQSAQLDASATAIGYGGYSSTINSSQLSDPTATWKIVRGGLTLRASSKIAQTSGFGAGQTVGELLLHELGHVVGLGHAAHADNLMYPVINQTPDDQWGAGDRAGLAIQGGSGVCLP